MRTKYKDQKSQNSGQALKAETKNNPTPIPFLLKSLILFFLLGSFATNAQAVVWMPGNGSNTIISCGINSQLYDDGGPSNDYGTYVYGTTFIDAGPTTVFMINGTFDTEQGYDQINIYDGNGTGGTILGTYDGLGSINFTSTPGQVVTIEFYSDGYTQYSGFDLAITYSNACFPIPCSGAPAANTVVASSSLVCPGASIDLDFSTAINMSGLSVQWKYGNNALGPFTSIGAVVPIVNSSSSHYVVPNATTGYWYTGSLMCGSGGTTVLTPVKVDVQGLTVGTIPYVEDFEGITQNDQLPNCSWSISNASRNETAIQSFGNPRVPRSGSNYAYFNGTPATSATEYFYTNGLQLTAGITYSAAMWYNVPGYASWGNLSLMVGTSQSPAGLVNIATVVSPNSNAYTALSNTFTIPTSGIYYIAIKAKGTNSYDYLAWDDLSITAPCSAGDNSPILSLAGPSVVCAGVITTFTASGADTYTWNTGANTPVTIETPTVTGVYSVIGESALTGCTQTSSLSLLVNQLPYVGVFYSGSLTNTICSGSAITLFATGANSYTWSQGAINGAVNTVTPSSSINYTVLGSDVFGCVGTAIQPIMVSPLPNITVQSSQSGLMCAGETAMLTASGASTYMWAGNVVLSGNPVMASPSQSTIYEVTGTDAFGCSNKTNFVLGISDCVGLNNVAKASGEIKLYPNPTNGEFSVELNNGLNKTIVISDLSGRVILSQVSSTDKTVVNMNNFAAGVYYVKVQTSETTNIFKLIKE